MPLPSTLQFLEDLSQHNDKGWFADHRERYDAARSDFEAFVEALRIALTPAIPQLAEQRARDLMFRIYRDVRFSKVKTPYKTHFSAYFSRAGRKAVDAGYYVHYEPGGNCFISAGMWQPQGKLMKAVRQEIDYSLAEIAGILEDKNFKKLWGGLEGERLRTVPQGYTAENPAIELLKYKSFIVSHHLPAEQWAKADVVKKIVHLCSVARPLIDFLNRAEVGEE
jgi:uncharacterized protein (TIGR02453 family)